MEAWRFQLTRQTVTIRPETGRTRDLFGVLAVFSGTLVVLDPTEAVASGILDERIEETLRSDDAMRLLKENGYRVLEQRFPAKA